MVADLATILSCIVVIIAQNPTPLVLMTAVKTNYKTPFCLFLFLGILFLSFSEADAQKTSVDLEYRFNPVYSRGFREPLYDGDRASLFTLQRTRLIANYENPDSLIAKVVLQDRRVWGEVNERADVPEIAIFRAWVEKYLNQNLSLKIGRQGLVYDDQYLFGELNWGGTLAHDVLLTKYKKGEFEAHLGLAYNSNRLNELKREVYDRAFYKSMQFLWAHRDWDRIKSSLIFINHGIDLADTTTRFTQTFGSNTTFNLRDNLDLQGIYYQQLGKDANDRKVNSNFWAIKLTWKTNDNLKMTLAAESTSGTDVREYSLDRGSSGTFDILYGLLHGHRGYIDYFYLLIDPIFGTLDYNIKAEYKPTNKFKLNNNTHAFFSHSNSYRPSDMTFSDPLDPFLGIENDLVLTWTYSKDFKLSFGHSVMFGTTTLDARFGGESSKERQFFYSVLTVSPRLFGKG